MSFEAITVINQAEESAKKGHAQVLADAKTAEVNAVAEGKATVERAIADSFHKKKISVYNPYIRAFHVLAKIVPHQWILFIMRFLK